MAKLIRMSEGASLAIHTLAILAREPKRRRPASELAEALAASEHHLAKILHRLVQAELLDAVRGPGGGVRLVPDPATVSLMMVYEVIDGVYPERSCLFDKAVCRGKGCVMGRALKEADATLNKYMSTHTLADVARTFKAGVSTK